ncbi:MAG: hypothetical protein WKF91_23250 [Segetibacter sp.]
MSKFKILVSVYLFSVVSSTFANVLGIDVQALYRVPFLSVRWIDLSILWIIASYLYEVTNNPNVLKTSNGITVSLCFIYLFFEGFQLLRSWGAINTGWQISWFLCTLNFFILVDLLTFKITTDKTILLLKFTAFWGAIVLIITNAYLLYSFIFGNVIFGDLDIRVGLDVIGTKETVSTAVLTPFVYAFSLYFRDLETVLWKKGIYTAAILGIYVELIITFHRGNLLSVILITVLYIFVFSRSRVGAFNKLLSMGVLVGSCYLLFGGILRQKGYDPLEKLTETIMFALDTDNPDWDKGRSISREFALNVWEKHASSGVGYVDLYHFGLPDTIATAHNFIITSLFHRGIIGTLIYLLILLSLFRNAIKLWSTLKTGNVLQNNILKLLVIVSFFWLIPFWTQEVIWEKHSLSIQFMYLGLISNLYYQRKTATNALVN